MNSQILSAIRNPNHQHRPDIDGLRAIAVMAVVLFHSGTGVSGGYVGVDVFFVVSGFLITKIILEDIQDGQFSYARFLERRVRRILPALIVVVLFSLGLGWDHLWPDDFISLAKSAQSVFLLVSNFYFFHDSGYFTGAAEFKPLLHTWSLAVEEQFYLLFPACLLFVRTQIGSKFIFKSFLLVAVASFLLSAITVFVSSSATFYLLPTRIWELLAGAILAVHGKSSQLSNSLNEGFSLAGLGAILLPAFIYDQTTLFPGPAALLPVLGTAAVIYTNTGRKTLVGRILAKRPIVFVGLISYSLYLWHWPLLVFMRIRYWNVPFIELYAIAISFPLSILTWKFVEVPFRKPWLNRRTVYRVGAACSLFIIIVCFGIIDAEGVHTRNPAFELLHRNAALDIADGDLLSGTRVVLGNKEPDNTKPLIDFFVIGDSHASTLLPVFDEIASLKNLNGLSLARASRSPFGDNNRNKSIKEAILKMIERHRPKSVFLAPKWSVLFGIEFPNKHYEEQLEVVKELIAICKKNGVRVRIITQIPHYAIPREVVRFQQIQAKNYPQHYPNPSINREELYRRNLPAITAFDHLSSMGAEIIDITPLFFDQDDQFRQIDSDYLLYWDDNHLTQYGAKLILSPFFHDLLTE